MTEAATTVAEPLPSAAEASTAVYEFDADFQLKLTGMVCRSDKFMRSASHLIEPKYFEDIGHRALVKVAKNHYDKYGVPLTDRPTAIQALKDAKASKILKAEELKAMLPVVVTIYGSDTTGSLDLSGVEFAMDKAAEFARTQAMGQAVLDSVELLARRDFEAIHKIQQAAFEVGIKSQDNSYDYMERIAERTEQRIDKAAGKTLATGITTGFPQLDEVLYHRGWGRKELASILGGAKAGKTTALIGFAKSAALAGHNVLYCTLEVSAAIIGDRLDATMSNTKIMDMGLHIKDVEAKIRAMEGKMGAIKVHEYPIGSLRPRDLEALLEKYEGEGMQFGLVVVDYGDIMAPDVQNKTDPRENSRLIYVGLRACMQRFNVAGLTATQTNRAGFMSSVAKAEHTSDDFNKVRIVDLLISINTTDEERAIGEGRLYFAAARNSESNFTLRIKQDIARMRFITAILGRD